MQGIEVISTGQAMPAKVLDNFELSTMMDTSDEWIVSRTGIKERRVCTTETCNSLAMDAAKQAVERAKSLDEDILSRIKVVVVASLTPDNAIPSTACLVKEELGLSDDVMSFDMNAACSGFLYGLQVLHSLLHSMPEARALLIGAEQLSRVMDYSDKSRGTSILFGDGAGAMILKLSDNPENIYHARSWSHGDFEALNCEGVGKSPAFVKMDGQRVFRFAVTAFDQAIKTILQETNVSMEEVDVIVCHQANLRIIDHMRKKYKDNADKFYVNIVDHGNTSAASVAIAFDDLFSTGRIKPGMKVLCVAFGAGLTWNGTLFTA